MGVVIEQELGTVHGDEMILNIGPQHPSTHGVLRLKVHTDGEIVTKITPVSYTHLRAHET